jgi:hypothetical protein
LFDEMKPIGFGKLIPCPNFPATYVGAPFTVEGARPVIVSVAVFSKLNARVGVG